MFLDRLTRSLCTRVSREQSPGGDAEQWSSDEEEAGFEMETNGARVRPVAAPRAALSEDTQKRLALLIVKLAAKAQYAKVSSTNRDLDPFDLA